MVGWPSQARGVLSKRYITISSGASNKCLLGWGRCIQKSGSRVGMMKRPGAIESPQRCITKRSRYTTSTKSMRSRDCGLEFAPALAGCARLAKPNAPELLGGRERIVLVIIIRHAVETSVDGKESGFQRIY